MPVKESTNKYFGTVMALVNKITGVTWHTLLGKRVVDTKKVLVVVKDVWGHSESKVSLVDHSGRGKHRQWYFVACRVLHKLKVTHHEGHKVGAHDLTHLKLVKYLGQWKHNESWKYNKWIMPEYMNKRSQRWRVSCMEGQLESIYDGVGVDGKRTRVQRT